jgi:NADH-quinone oxidoreductase subunit M
VGKVSLVEYHGLYPHMPLLAVTFLVTGLSAIGFPGTIGFVVAELLVEGALRASPAIAVVVVLVTALNGVALLRTYFRLFTGAQHTSSISIEARPPEKLAVLVLMVLIIGGGLWPQPGVASRYDVARELIKRRVSPFNSMTAASATDRASLGAASVDPLTQD